MQCFFNGHRVKILQSQDRTLISPGQCIFIIADGFACLKCPESICWVEFCPANAAAIGLRRFEVRSSLMVFRPPMQSSNPVLHVHCEYCKTVVSNIRGASSADIRTVPGAA